MELLLIILVLIIVILTFLLLKKERVFGINTEDNSEKEKVKIIESKDYRNNLYDLLNYIPEAVIILDKSKKIIFSNNSSNKLFQIKLNENISGFLRNPDLLNSIDKAFQGTNVTDLEIEIRNLATQRLNITAYFCLLYTSPSPRDRSVSRMPSSA